MTSFNIDNIIVEEIVEYTTETKDGKEGIGVKISYLQDKKMQMIYDIDGIQEKDMKHVSTGILSLLRFIKNQLEGEEIPLPGPPSRLTDVDVIFEEGSQD